MDSLQNLDPLYALAVLLWLLGMGLLTWLMLRTLRDTDEAGSNTRP